MEKRKIIFGTYDTAAVGWTLTAGWAFSEPELKENYVAVPGHNGDLDLSTVLTDGEPCYGNRSLTATFECSEGNRMEREDIIREMVNELDGFRMNIVLPDDPQRYITGRVRVARLYNDPAHASVQVTAVCDPWRYNAAETVIGLQGTNKWQNVTLYNMGRRSVVPTITVTEGTMTFRLGTSSLSVNAGTHVWPTLYLKKGTTLLRYISNTGSGVASISYREAVL